MTADTPLGFFSRLAIAWQVLMDATVAARLHAPPPALLAPPAASPAVPTAAATAHNADHGALLLLSILQREGRLVDFLMEDIATASDADVGAGARVVHQGCSKALKQLMALSPVRAEAEGAAVVLAPGFDAAQVRLSGNVTGEPPYRGTLSHPGWRATRVDLPQRSAQADPSLVAPAEVEL